MTKTLRFLLACGLAVAGDHLRAIAAAPPTPQGYITAKAFTGISGTGVAALTGNPKFPNTPDVMVFLPYFEWNATGDINVPPGNWADNYGTQIIGYFYPPVDGDYVFYLCADDNAVLYLSTDANPENKKLIAQETAYSNPREYTTSAGNSTLTSKDSSQFTGTEWPTKDPVLGGAVITLKAYQPYYIEALAKEGGGGDNLSVAVLDPSYTIDFTAPIPGQYLSSDRSLGPVTIVRQPVSQSVDERGSVTFSVLVDGTPPYTIQWRRNGVNIPDATNLTYTVASAAMADNGAKFSVAVTGAEGTAVSDDATLTVIPDTVSPVLVGARGSSSLTEVALTFSEPMDNATATTLANYEITHAGGTLEVTGATLSPDGTLVTLSTAQQQLRVKYTVKVNGLLDTAATPNSIAPNSKAVFFAKGKLVEIGGFIVFEAENYDRNLDGRWVPNTTRGTPSGGVSMLIPNGAGGSEGATKLEYDVEFKQAATYYVWYRASADNGNDDSMWFHLDGERPPERSSGNQASMTGFQPQADFVWRSDSQDGPDPFTVEVPSEGLHVVSVARREDGAFFDKMILTTDSTFTPTGFGPPETREGAPAAPTVTVTAPTSGQKFFSGADIVLTATGAGDLGLEIIRVEFRANGVPVGAATASPFTYTWSNVPDGNYAITATAVDEIGGTADSAPVLIEVGGESPHSARIAWISYHPDADIPSSAAAAAGFTRAPDAPYTDLLTAKGHRVTRIVTSGNPNVTLLNTFDLVIISRSVPSGDYQDPPETAAWNGLAVPVIQLGGYVLRNSRLGYTTGGTMVDTTGPIRLTVLDPAHPVFAGIALDQNNTMVNVYADVVMFNNTVERGISVNTDPLAGNGVVLATVGTATDPTYGGMVIGEWQKGAVMATAAGDVLGGHRLVFLTGSREHSGLTSEGAGIYDLSPEGAKLFLNAVYYMSGKQPPPEVPTVSLTRTEAGLVITFTGILQSAASITGPWTNVANATSPLTVSPTAAQMFYRAMQ